MSKEIGTLNIEVESASDQENIKIKIDSNGEDKLVFLGMAKFVMEYARQNNRSVQEVMKVFNNIVNDMNQDEKELNKPDKYKDIKEQSLHKPWDLMFIAVPGKEEEYYENMVANIKYFVITHCPESMFIKNTDYWGVKHLAYDIGGYKEGYYILMSFTTNRRTMGELDEYLKYREDVLRHMMVAKSED